MALYGVIADVHGNREALAAALAALDRRQVSGLLCLGDIVGYNADPDECVEMVRSRGALAIAGNHDLIGLGRLDFARCSNKAMYSLKRTRRDLAAASAAYLAALPGCRVIDERIVLVHGGVRDVEQYMVSSEHIRHNAQYLRADFPQARLCFFGHSHEQKVYRVDQDRVLDVSIAPSMPLLQDGVYFINPGSVDASRKREHKLAEFAVLDTDASRLEFWQVPYDCAATEAKAVVFGYRIPPLVERFYAVRRRILPPARRRHAATSAVPAKIARKGTSAMLWRACAMIGTWTATR
jgi:predicted phosphodiesterase